MGRKNFNGVSKKAYAREQRMNDQARNREKTSELNTGVLAVINSKDDLAPLALLKLSEDTGTTDKRLKKIGYGSQSVGPKKIDRFKQSLTEIAAENNIGSPYFMKKAQESTPEATNTNEVQPQPQPETKPIPAFA